jgi:predicted DNA-binding protein (MmcQ/YjbR family)
MNKKNWISILLNDTVPDKVLLTLLDESHRFTIKNKISKTETTPLK